MHGALQSRCPTPDDGKSRDDDGDANSTSWVPFSPRSSGTSIQMLRKAMAGMVRPMLAIAEARARFRLV